MKRCKHENVSFYETIPAQHQRYFEGDEYFCNNEYQMGRINAGVKCIDCKLHIPITDNNQNKLPKWVQRRIEIMKKNNDWFL